MGKVDTKHETNAYENFCVYYTLELEFIVDNKHLK